MLARVPRLGTSFQDLRTHVLELLAQARAVIFTVEAPQSSPETVVVPSTPTVPVPAPFSPAAPAELQAFVPETPKFSWGLAATAAILAYISFK